MLQIYSYLVQSRDSELINVKLILSWYCKILNPLSPNRDQQQFSPNNIHMLPREMVITVNKMISKEKML